MSLRKRGGDAPLEKGAFRKGAILLSMSCGFLSKSDAEFCDPLERCLP
mgnify:CR=1 FL=1